MMILGLPRTEGPQPINLTMNEHTSELGLGSYSTTDSRAKTEAAVPAGQTAGPTYNSLFVTSRAHTHSTVWKPKPAQSDFFAFLGAFSTRGVYILPPGETYCSTLGQNQP